ncbi:MAG: ABC transporter substrate-binding protein [Chloroflexi bacterium]|nr:ABC transporter substrate-binding protein [Chloroflexota bacterium]
MAPESQYWTRFWRRRLSRRRLLQATGVSAAGLAVAGVVGCGDNGEPGATATAPAETPTDAGPKMGGTLKGTLVGLSTINPPTLDSQRQLTYLAQIPAGYHYSRLVKNIPPTPQEVNGVPSIPVDFSNVEGDAAESLPEIDDTGTVFNFKIRDNLNFHDVAPVNGRPVTAEDVKLAFDLFAAESPHRGNWLTVVESVEVTGDKTLKITLRQPFGPAFQVLFGNNDGGPWIIPSEVIDSEELSNTKPIGSGPWIFDSWEPDVVMRWRKNPDYYDAPKPYIDVIENSLIGDPETILQNLSAGNLDASLWSAELWDRGLSEMPDAQFFTGPEQVWGGAFFNFGRPPFNDKRVRQALSMSIDRKGILGALDQPGAAGGGLTHVSQFANFYVDPINDAATFGDNAKYYQRDVEGAKALLAEAGFPDGVDLTASSSSAYGPGFGAQMEAFAASAAEAGFRMELNLQEYGAYISTSFYGVMGDNELGLAPLMGSPMDPHNIFSTIFHPASARHNWGRTADVEGSDPVPADQLPIEGDGSPAGDAALLALWSQQAAETDFDTRVELVRDVQRMMAESMYLIPWPGESAAYIFQPWVKNIQLIRGYAYGLETAVNLWLDKA